ncbi:hypothetical protein BU202_02225 [Streptococcus cuniculi]|uniref:Winged helix DNA-binding domain-containing protein n=1 Tax=Streptococcus cuniculi TaxID=1432788 RepID=A0A1Q8E9J2_9STRE|nr:crosslink repair DNA glycosylase YcaQ family protein [Streptococcus cuniculi]OLF48454.1 hypothetical protein BU202_02225 [Streptococcus cuniculi]
MKHEEWKSMILAKQGLTKSYTVEEICQNLNGLQAQFQPYVDVGFETRLSEREFSDAVWREKLVRQWSIRGTVHAYLKSEIPLYLYEGMKQFSLPLDQPSRDGTVSAQTKQRFHQILVEALEERSLTREELKTICREQGMTKEMETFLFNSWGGLLRYMVEAGEIYQTYGERRFHCLPAFEPWSKEAAELEIARRYFAGFGPVSLADARYYFKESKSKILTWMKQLDLQTIEVEGETRYYLGELETAAVPQCLFIAGFDQILLGYEKKANPFFDSKYIRNIYTLTGIVKPVVFFKGRLVATWKKEKKNIILDIFELLSQTDLQELEKCRKAYEERGRI